MTPNPTPEEIRAACRRIQEAWKPKQERNRAGNPTRKWEPAVVRISDLAAAASEVLANEQP